MKVKELIELLQKYPPHYNVRVGWLHSAQDFHDEEIVQILQGDPSHAAPQDDVKLRINRPPYWIKEMKNEYEV